MGGKRGFTLVELMVVMAIIAVLAVIGLSALMNINRGNIVDRATEEIVTSIRESQNKAISVANDPNGAASMPLAWGVQVDPGAKTAKLFAITNLQPTSTVTKVLYGDIDVSTLDSIEVSGGKEYFYTTPFGKYYSVNVYSETGWIKNSQRPYDIFPPQPGAEKTKITLDYKGNVRTVVIETNGDVYAQ